MKGWVYVISNRAMPGLVKVGFSTKDPELRASDLNHTGSPHPYLVEYELLIEEPRNIEQRVHSELSHVKEAKEWFRCTAEQAVATIKAVAGPLGMHETYKRVERAKAEEIQSALMQEREIARTREAAAKDLENIIVSEESLLRNHWEQRIKLIFPPSSFLAYWLGGAILCLIGIALLSPKISDSGGFFLCAIGGAVVGYVLQIYFDNERLNSTKYTALIQQRDAEMAGLRVKTIACLQCKTNLRFDRAKIAEATTKSGWSCPKCHAAMQAPWT